MKKIVLTLTLISLLIFCCSCGFVKEKDSFWERIDEVESVSIVELGEWDQRNDIFIQKTLFHISDIDTFKEELLELKSKTHWGDPVQLESGDVVIKMVFENQDFHLIGWNAQLKCSEDKNSYGYTIFEKEAFEALIEKWKTV